MANRVIEGARRAMARTLLGKDWQSYLVQRMTGALPGDQRSYVGDDDFLGAPSKVSWVYACCRIISEAFSKPAWWFEDEGGRRCQSVTFRRRRKVGKGVGSALAVLTCRLGGIGQRSVGIEQRP